ncbi:MAG: AAA family ATPase, partial [Verrucomicrobiota bacterium]
MIQKLILQNFRCHETFACDGLEQNVMIVGENGKGKTSFLEAIYILSRCRSFRTPRIRECVGWNKRGFGISGLLVEESQEAKRIKFEWSRAGRQMSLGSSENVSLKAFWGSFHAVAFVNNDRQLVTGGGSNRRQW